MKNVIAAMAHDTFLYNLTILKTRLGEFFCVFIYLWKIAASGGPPREFAVGYGLSLKSGLRPRFDALPTPQIIKVAPGCPSDKFKCVGLTTPSRQLTWRTICSYIVDYKLF